MMLNSKRQNLQNRTAIFLVLLCISSLVFLSCGKNYSTEEKEYITKIEKIRSEKNSEMKNDPNSPFNQDSNAHFAPLKYFDVNPEFVFKSKLYECPSKDTIKIYGTKGDERKVVRFGYVNITMKGKGLKINVYKGKSKAGVEYYSLWFTDRTTNKESYGVGRYIDFEKKNDIDYVYTIDFNLSYNPYCSYSSKYSCAIPTKEDYIDVSIEAGEKKFHE